MIENKNILHFINLKLLFMKKIILMAAALLTVGMASAQITYSIGYINTATTATVETSVGGVKLINDSHDSWNGFTIGLDDNINLSGDFNVAPGVGMAFSMRSENDIKYKKFGIYVPVDFNYGFDLGSDFRLSVFAGPTCELGIVNNAKDDDGDKVNYYDKDNAVNFGRFDILMGGGIWLTFQDQLRFSVGYKAGLLNTSKTDDLTVKNNVLSISFGYIF